MKHSSYGNRHNYQTDIRPTAEQLIRKLMDARYWFEVEYRSGFYSITCGVHPQFLNDSFKMNVEGSIKGNYKRKKEVA